MNRRVYKFITLAPAIFVVAVLVGVIVAFAPTCSGGEDGPATSASEVAGNPEPFFGDEVTIEARVSNPIDHRVWEVAGGQLFVIFDRGLDRGLENGALLRVSGTVHPLKRSVIEDELGIDIEDHFFAEAFLADDVALVADQVTRLQPR